MRKYIYHFDTESDFNEMRSAENYDEPWLSLTEYNLDENIPVTDVARVDYNKTEREKLLETPLTFEIQSDGNIRWQKQSTSAPIRTIEYSKDNGETWTSITSATGDTAPSISVVSGDTIQFRGNNSSYGTSNSYYNSFAGSTCSFSVKGNIMSLINSTDFPALTDLSTYTFCNLFKDCTGLTDVSELLLPATTLATACYRGMFHNCTSLVNAPALPATTLASSCYSSMFAGCTSLVNGPSSIGTSATTMASNACYYMFGGCTSLTQAPELPATTLASECYDSMFRDCINLNYIKCLATDISAEYCTYYWVSGVASTGTFITPSSTSWSTGNDGIPSGWTRVDAS